MTTHVLRGIFVLCLVTTQFPGASAAPQDDCGTLSDAPNDPGSAADVGTFCTGALVPEEGDPADWFRVASMPGKGIRVRLDSPTGGYQLQVFDDVLQGRFDSFCCGGPEGGGPCCGGWPGTHVEAYVGEIGPAYRIGVSACCQGGPYSLSVEYLDLYQLRIDSVTITKRYIETDLGETPVSTQRTVRVTVTNLGPGVSYAAGVGAWANHEFGGRDLGGMGLPALPAGNSTTVDIPWDTTGEVGDVRIHVWANGALQNNSRGEAHAEKETFVHVGNAGTGADLFSHHTGRCDANGCIHANTAYGHGGKGLWVHQNNQTSNTFAHVGTHPGNAHVFVDRHDPDQNLRADVGTSGNIQLSLCPTNGDPCTVG